MTHSDITRLAELLAMLCEVFNEPMSDAKAEGFYVALEDLAIDAIERAGMTALRDETFFPRPAYFRQAIIGNAHEQALTAWTHLMREIKRVGWTGVPQLHPTLDRVVQSLWGSWRGLCETLPASGRGYEAEQRRFDEAYLAECRADDRALKSLLAYPGAEARRVLQ